MHKWNVLGMQIPVSSSPFSFIAVISLEERVPKESGTGSRTGKGDDGDIFFGESAFSYKVRKWVVLGLNYPPQLILY